MAISHILHFTIYGNTKMRNSMATIALRILSAVNFDVNAILIYVVTKYLELCTNNLQFMTLPCVLVSIYGYVGLSNLLYVLILYKFSARFVGLLKIIHADINIYSTSVLLLFFVASQFVFHLWHFLPWKSCSCHILCYIHLHGLCKSCYLGLIFL
jgi:hypothetical protein